MIAPLPTTIADWVAYYHYDEDFTPVPATERTGARPGSAEKIEVMAQRVLLGQSLWHPDDEPIPLPSRETSLGYRSGIRECAVVFD